MASREERKAVIAQAAKLCDPKTCSIWLLRSVDVEKSGRQKKVVRDGK